MFFESLKKRNNELKVCRGSMPCYSALSVMISGRFALAGGKSAKSNQTEGDFFGSKAHNPRWISESFWGVLYSIRLG